MERGDYARPQRALRRARARHGRDRERARPPRLPRVRLHVLQLPRLHEAGGAARVADAASRPSTCTRTTRSASARTARPISRWSSSPRCARSRTSTACGRRDANETALAWKFALEQTETPTALVLSRQGLPIVSRDDIPDDAIDRGAYVLRDSSNGEPDVILIGTGSEVHICSARRRAARGGRRSPRAWCRRPASTASPSRTTTTATASSRAACGRASPSRRPRHLAGAPGSERMGTRSAMTTFGAVGAPARPLRALRLHPGEGGRARTRGRRARVRARLKGVRR